MEQYRQILEKVARQELEIAVLWSVVLVAVLAVVWVCCYLVFRKVKGMDCRNRKKTTSQSKLLRQSSWAALALTGILLAIGGVLWGSAVRTRWNIRQDLEQDAYVTYSGSYEILDNSVFSNRLYDRWTKVDFEQGYAHLYINSPLEWLETDYGAYEGTLVYGRNSLIVVDMQPQE